MIELDVQLTRDGVLAVVHDFDLARLAGTALRPEDVQWSALENVRLHAAPGSEPESIPNLQAVFDALPAAFPVNIELKRQRAAAARLARAAASFADHPGSLFSSFDWDLLAELKRLAPRAALAPLAGDDTGIDPFLRAAERLSARALHVSLAFARQFLSSLSGTGLPVLCYTVNDFATASYLLDSGAFGVFSDRPGHLRRALGLSPPQSIRMPCSSP